MDVGKNITDLTLVYYSAHALPKQAEVSIRNELLKTTKGTFPIISVTQKPIDFGENICVGEIGQSYYNCFKQIYTAVQRVKTEYVAMTEDDSLYNMEHFSHRPSSDGVFSYNRNIWFLETNRHQSIFWTKGQTAMLSCIVASKLLLTILEQRFNKYIEEPMPRENQKHAWQEPGRDEGLGFANQKTEIFSTDIPIIALNYYGGTGGKLKARGGSTSAEELEYWGNANDLRKRIFKG